MQILLTYLLGHFSGADIFSSLPRSCTIDLSYNFLEHIDPMALWSFKSVNLRDNKLKSIPPYRPMELQPGTFFLGKVDEGKSINSPEHVLLSTSARDLMVASSVIILCWEA